jgi:hypothetical protein
VQALGRYQTEGLIEYAELTAQPRQGEESDN